MTKSDASPIRAAVDRWVAKKALLGHTPDPNLVNDLVEDLESALQSGAPSNAFHQFVHTGVLVPYDEGRVDVVAFAAAGPDEIALFNWFAPMHQAVLADALRTLTFEFDVARKMDRDRLKAEGMRRRG